LEKSTALLRDFVFIPGMPRLFISRATDFNYCYKLRYYRIRKNLIMQQCLGTLPNRYFKTLEGTIYRMLDYYYPRELNISLGIPFS